MFVFVLSEVAPTAVTLVLVVEDNSGAEFVVFKLSKFESFVKFCCCCCCCCWIPPPIICVVLFVAVVRIEGFEGDCFLFLIEIENE